MDDKGYAKEYEHLKLVLKTEVDPAYKLALIAFLIQHIESDADPQLSPAARFQLLKNLKRHRTVIEYRMPRP